RLSVFFFLVSLLTPALYSFPTRRSSDLLNFPDYFPGKPVSLPKNFLSLRIFLLFGFPLPKNFSLLLQTPQRAWRVNVSVPVVLRSEEHTSELQSRFDLVCRLLLEKKK